MAVRRVLFGIPHPLRRVLGRQCRRHSALACFAVGQCAGHAGCLAVVAALGRLAPPVGGTAPTHRVAMVVLGGRLQGQCGTGLADEPDGLIVGRGLQCAWLALTFSVM